MITILDVVKSVVGKKETYTVPDHAQAGVNILGGCQDCHATIASYNAYPTRGGYWKCGNCVGDNGFATVEAFRRATYEPTPNLAPTAEALVQVFTDADQAWAYHTQVCYDQEERYGCGECSELSRNRSEARRAMEANPEAKALYDSCEQREQRRRWTREVFRPLNESMSRYDDY